MIFLEVTAACLLPLESGIPRTTRGLWRFLQGTGAEITPVVWQPFRHCYTRLSRRSHALLAGTMASAGCQRSPRDSTLPLLWASFCDLKHRSPEVDLPRVMRREDTLLLTSLFPDNRLGYLQNLLGRPGRKMAIFHDAIPLQDSNVSGWERKRHLKTVHLLARLDLVIAVSESARRDLHALWNENKIAPARTAVLPWPVLFKETRPSFTEPDQVSPRLLYVSRLKQVKNHATLFLACEALWSEGARFELELIGCEDEARESRALLHEIGNLQKQGRPVSWRAQVSEAELHRAYERATFTVFPSLMEGFGLPIIESLWHGRAVVCGEDGPMNELAQGGGCLTANMRDPQALAHALRKLLDDPARCLALSREAYSRPVRTWADYGRELLPLLKDQ